MRNHISDERGSDRCHDDTGVVSTFDLPPESIVIRVDGAGAGITRVLIRRGPADGTEPVDALPIYGSHDDRATTDTTHRLRHVWRHVRSTALAAIVLVLIAATLTIAGPHHPDSDSSPARISTEATGLSPPCSQIGTGCFPSTRPMCSPPNSSVADAARWHRLGLLDTRVGAVLPPILVPQVRRHSACEMTPPVQYEAIFAARADPPNNDVL